MEASKLTIDPNHLRFDKMTNGKRSKLRKENIKSLIRSKPAGTLIMVSEFQAVTMSSNPSTSVMLKNMVKRGEITRHQDDHFKSRYSWAVNEDVKVRVPKAPKAVAPSVGFDTETIVEKAKSYVWQQDDDSLRGFIKWLEGGEKNLPK